MNHSYRLILVPVTAMTVTFYLLLEMYLCVYLWISFSIEILFRHPIHAGWGFCCSANILLVLLCLSLWYHVFSGSRKINIYLNFVFALKCRAIFCFRFLAPNTFVASDRHVLKKKKKHFVDDVHTLAVFLGHLFSRHVFTHCLHMYFVIRS